MLTFPHKTRTVLCGGCNSAVEAKFVVRNGVPVGQCPHCGQKMRLLAPGRPDVQNRQVGQ